MNIKDCTMCMKKIRHQNNICFLENINHVFENIKRNKKFPHAQEKKENLKNQ